MYNEIKTWSGISVPTDPESWSGIKSQRTHNAVINSHIHIDVVQLSDSAKKVAGFSPTVQSHILVPNQVPIKMIAPPHIWLIIPENIRVRYFYRNTISFKYLYFFS